MSPRACLVFVSAVFSAAAFGACSPPDSYNPGDPSTPEYLASRVLQCGINPYCASPYLEPSAISGLRLWLKADAITGINDGDLVGGWSDFSGNGNNATQTLISRQPKFITNAVNGLPVVRFDSTGPNHLELPEFIDSSDVTLAIVMLQTTNTGGLQYIFNDMASSATPWLHFYADTTKYVFGVRDASATNLQKAQGDGRQTGIFVGQIAGQFLQFSMNGNVVTRTRTDFTPVTDWSASFAQPRIGGQPNAPNSQSMNGDIAEIVFFNRSLEEWERWALECQLGAKYNISLSHACGVP